MENTENKSEESEVKAPEEAAPEAKAAPAPDAPDLEKLRDEKCVPVVREILKDFATDLMPEVSPEGGVTFIPLVQKIVKKTLDVDMNIATETSYVFQLLLGVLSGINVTMQKAAVIPTDEIRFDKIARQILEIVSESEITIGNVTPEDTERDFAPVLEKVNKILAVENLSQLELKYIMDKIFTNFTAVNNLFQQALEINSARAEAKLFGIEAMSDLTMKRLDEVLRSEG